MDVALKQRLVGASVLVALGVIFIPMLLDGSPGGTRETTIDIPQPPDRRFETRLLPVDTQAAREAEPASQPQTEPVESSTRTASPERPPSVAVSRTQRETPPEPQPTTPDPEPPAAASAMGGDRWVLQLGSFGNAANAARLVDNLKQAGWNAYQERVSVGEQTLYRVRAGSWDSKGQAADAGSKISAAFPDLDLSVRRIEAASAPAAESPVDGWMVQVGSFGSRKNAYDLRDRLRAAGYASNVVEIPGASGGTFRVRVGPEVDRSAAEQVRDRLRSDMSLNGIIVRHP